MNLRVTLATGRKGDGLELANPVMTAAGAFGGGVELARDVDIQRLGAMISPALGRSGRLGSGPGYWESAAGLLSASPGPRYSLRRILRDYAAAWRAWNLPLLASLPADDLDDCLSLAAQLEAARCVSGLELDFSNRLIWGSAGEDRDVLARFVEALAHASALPLLVKLPASAGRLRSLARAAQASGADAITVAGLFPALAIDHVTRRPIFPGGALLQGPAVKPLTLLAVANVAASVTIPLIAEGGISSGADALEFLLAGASAVQVGAACFADPWAPLRVLDELVAFLDKRGEDSVRNVIGALHQE